jgi:hypothetical protein
MRGVAAGEPWVAARLALEIGIAPMVAADEIKAWSAEQPKIKHAANFRHGEVSAKDSGFKWGAGLFHVEHSGEE